MFIEVKRTPDAVRNPHGSFYDMRRPAAAWRRKDGKARRGG